MILILILLHAYQICILNRPREVRSHLCEHMKYINPYITHTYTDVGHVEEGREDDKNIYLFGLPQSTVSQSQVQFAVFIEEMC